MDIDRLKAIEGSLERASALYEGIFTDERSRLSADRLWLEARTTLHVLGQELKPDSTVLDLGCGAGVYALPLASQGHRVLAVDLVPHHIEQLQAQTTLGMAIEARCTDAQSALDQCRDASFDAVLCLGPMYHLRTLAERLKLLRSCRRVLKPGGRLFVAFINNDWVIATMTLTSPDGSGSYIRDGDYDQRSFRADDMPFVFHTLEQADAELAAVGLTTRRRINADGLNELLIDRFRVFTKEERELWFRFHLYLCEKREHLGACNHWLFVCGG